MADDPKGQMTNFVGNLPVDPKDPWALAQSGYSKDKIYTRSTNGHDHSETLYVKLSPALMAVVSECVEKVGEYRTKADVVRDALVHRMRDVQGWMQDPDHINLQPVDTEVRMAELERTLANMSYWDSLIETFDNVVRKLIEQGDYETATYFIQENAAVESMTTPYINKLGAVIDKHREALGRLAPRDS